MKNIILITSLLIILFWNSANSQQKRPIEQSISEDICECFGEYSFEVADQRINQAVDTCINKVVKKYKTELEAYFTASKNADYNTGYRAGMLFFKQKVAPLLFMNCEALKRLTNPKGGN